MNAISGNPYRALGLFANCTEREIARQVAKLSRYAEIGKNVEFESDLPFLGAIDRAVQNISDSAARIERREKKLHWAMFWFVNANHVDETAFGHLKAGNVEKADEIWSLAIKDKPVTIKNFSAVSNLSTLQLGLVTHNKKLDIPALTRAVQLKGALLTSDAYDSFVQLVIGTNTHSIRSSAGKEFVDEILQLLKPHFNKRGGVATKHLVTVFDTFPDEIQSYLLGKFTAGPVRRIESEIAKAKNSRTTAPRNADVTGLKLYGQTFEDLSTLRSAVGAKGAQYQILVNKVAYEILQSAIDYFNNLVEDYDGHSVDPGPGALGLVKLVRLLEPTGEVKDRLDENAPTVEEWVAEKSKRDKKVQVKGDIEFITNALDGFQGLADSPTTALRLLQSCQPKLDHIAFVVGNDDELYLKISDAVAGNAVGMTIAAINAAQDKAQAAFDSWDPRVAKLKYYLDDASKVMALLTEFHLSPHLRSRCEENGRTIVQIMGQLGMRVAHPPKRTATPRKPSGAAHPVDRAENLFQGLANSGFVHRMGYLVSKHPGVAILSGIILLAVIGSIVSSIGDSTRNAAKSNTNSVDPAKTAPTGMVYVPPTTFTMGRNQGSSVAESPAHPVTLKSFYIDVNETTNAEYQKFVLAVNYPPPKSWVGKAFKPGQDKYPVVGVNYADAEAYARWAGKRLPTEEEWELSARGTDGRIYPWGNIWIKGNANADPDYIGFSPVGSYTIPSPYGLLNVIGNAWEWTSTDFKAYPGGTLPKEFSGKINLKTIRGGSFSTPKEYATTTYRIGWQAVGARNYDATGFRCAKDAPK